MRAPGAIASVLSVRSQRERSNSAFESGPLRWALNANVSSHETALLALFLALSW